MLDNFRWTFFFFKLDVFIFKLYHTRVYDFFTLSYNPDLGTEFIPNRLWDKWRISVILLTYYTGTLTGFLSNVENF
jgi:hypothetical protein